RCRSAHRATAWPRWAGRRRRDAPSRVPAAGHGRPSPRRGRQHRPPGRRQTPAPAHGAVQGTRRPTGRRELRGGRTHTVRPGQQRGRGGVMSRTLKVGTRGSTLATTQAGHVRDALIAAGYPAELVIVRTRGDVVMAPV